MVTSSSSSIHDEFQGTGKEDSVTLRYLMLTKAIPEDVLLMLSDKDTTKEAWATLHTMHMGAEPVKEAKVQTLRSDCKVIRDTIEEITVVKKFLRAVLIQWMQIVTSIEQDETNIIITHERLGYNDLREPTRGIVDASRGKGEPQVESNVWYLDNGASNHMIEDRSKFHELDKSVSGRVKFEDGSIVAIMGKGSVLFDCKNGHSTCLLAIRDELAWVWHSRLGHVNFYSLRRLVEKNIALGVPLINHPNKVCEGCVLAKQKRILLPKQAVVRAKKTPRDWLLENRKYFVLLIDDFSRWSWVYMLTRKFEAFEAFKWYKKMVEESSGYKVKTLRTDHGGEFTSKEFAKYCEENELEGSSLSDIYARTHEVTLEPEELLIAETDQPSTFKEAVLLEQFGMQYCILTKSHMEPKLKVDNVKGGEEIDSTEYKRLLGCLRYLTYTRPDLSYSYGRYDFLPWKEITWQSQKQKTVALSSCEAKFMAATSAACQAIWLANLMKELTGQNVEPITLFVDNKSTIALMKNPVFHGRSKHVNIHFHFIRECVKQGKIIVEHVNSKDQRAELFTKALALVKFIEMRNKLGLTDTEPGPV
ncbi:zinc finger, CCHC-type containing protein [Tanacetum coccineum]